MSTSVGRQISSMVVAALSGPCPQYWIELGNNDGIRTSFMRDFLGMIAQQPMDNITCL